MIKRKFKKFVVPTVYSLAIFAFITSMYFLEKTINNNRFRNLIISNFSTIYNFFNTIPIILVITYFFILCFLCFFCKFSFSVSIVLFKIIKFIFCNSSKTTTRFKIIYLTFNIAFSTSFFPSSTNNFFLLFFIIFV